MQRTTLINLLGAVAIVLILGSAGSVIMLWLTLAQALPLIIAGLVVFGACFVLAMFETGKKRRVQEQQEAPTLIQ
jgi:hypothetical protein